MWQQWSLKACWQVREHDVLHLTNLGTDQSRWIRKRDDGWRREKRDAERLTVRWWGCTVSISLWQCQSWKCSDCLVWSWMNKSSMNSWGWFPRLYWQNPANCFSVSARAFHQRHCKGNWDCCWGKNKLTFTAVTPALCAWNWVRTTHFVKEQRAIFTVGTLSYPSALQSYNQYFGELNEENKETMLNSFGTMAGCSTGLSSCHGKPSVGSGLAPMMN